MSRSGFRAIAGFSVAAALLLAPTAAHATDFPVTNTNDTGAGSLRQAITDANANSGPDAIPINTTGTLTLGSALPDIMQSVTITGPGMNQFTIDGADSHHLVTTFSGITISITGLTLTNAQCEICGPGGAAGGAIHNAADLTLTDVALTNNTASADGGGAVASVSAEGGAIRNLGQMTIVQSRLTGNTAEATGATSNAHASGGAIVNHGTLTLDRTTLDSNTAAASGGDNTGANGGAITNFGTLTIFRSTLSNNTASGTGGSSNGAFGGSIENANDSTNVNIDIDRSTISGNTATATGGNGQGGGMEIFGAASSQVTSSTIAHNTAESGSNLVAFTETHLKNTIVSNPDGPDNCLGSPTSDGYNLTNTTCNFTQATDQQNADPMLQALASNGGPTKTHGLNDGSDAIDQGLSSVGESVDQRGEARPFNFPGIASAAGGNGTDVGAFELQQTDRPQTIIDSGPTGTTHDPTPTFSFHSPDAGSTFECKVDAGPFGSCTSPKTFGVLADGPHTFTVRALDAALNADPTPASRSFTVKTATISRSGSTLLITATAGTKDNIRISRPSPSTIRISDAPSGAYTGSGVHAAAGSGCTRISDFVADCNAAGVTSVTANGGGLTDKLTNLAPLPGKLLAGPANDILTGGSSNDTLNGGTGADSFRGMNGNDTLLARDSASDTLINCDGGTTPGSADKAILDALPKDPASIVFGCETRSRP